MAESLISQLLKKGQEPDPLASIGQGGYGLQQPQNPIMDAANVVGEHLTPEYLKNPNVHGLTPNEVGKTPRSQPDNPLPWLAPDLASAVPAGAAKVAAPFMKSMFFGPLAKTANLAKLAKAKDMSSQWAHDFLSGKTLQYPGDLEAALPAAMRARDKQVYNETGWFRRPDSKWRFNDEDSSAILHPDVLEKAYPGNKTNLDEGLVKQSLYDAYPKFRDTQLERLPNFSPNLGEFDIGANKLAVRHSTNPLFGGHKSVPLSAQEITSTGLHEGQHAVQGVEDFARGSNPDYLANFGGKILKAKGIEAPYSPEVKQKLEDAAFNLYSRHSGEEESRMVQNLFGLQPAIQRHAYPGNSLIAPSKQVVPGNWLSKQTPETQEFIKNTMTHQFQGGPPTLENYIKLLMQDAK